MSDLDILDGLVILAEEYDRIPDPEKAHLCKVCIGLSPRWDGHSVNPPCKGYLQQNRDDIVEDIMIRLGSKRYPVSYKANHFTRKVF